MRKHILLLSTVALVNVNPSAFAGSVAGNGGSTEITQIANNMQLTASYAQQTQQYSTQLLQYQAQMQNLMRNPTSLLGADTSKLLNGVGTIMQAGASIGGTMARIDGNFSQKYQNPLAGTFSQNFKNWTTTSTDTLGASLRSAGMHRDQFASDTEALTALFNKSQQSDGTVAAVQQLSAINAMQIQQNQKLQDLIATQNIAMSTYMAGREAKDQGAMDNNDAIQNGFIASKPTNLPTIDTNTRTYKKWDLYTPR